MKKIIYGLCALIIVGASVISLQCANDTDTTVLDATADKITQANDVSSKTKSTEISDADTDDMMKMISQMGEGTASPESSAYPAEESGGPAVDSFNKFNQSPNMQAAGGVMNIVMMVGMAAGGAAVLWKISDSFKELKEWVTEHNPLASVDEREALVEKRAAKKAVAESEKGVADAEKALKNAKKTGLPNVIADAEKSYAEAIEKHTANKAKLVVARENLAEAGGKTIEVAKAEIEKKYPGLIEKQLVEAKVLQKEMPKLITAEHAIIKEKLAKATSEHEAAAKESSKAQAELKKAKAESPGKKASQKTKEAYTNKIKELEKAAKEAAAHENATAEKMAEHITHEHAAATAAHEHAIAHQEEMKTLHEKSVHSDSKHTPKEKAAIKEKFDKAVTHAKEAKLAVKQSKAAATKAAKESVKLAEHLKVKAPHLR